MDHHHVNETHSYEWKTILPYNYEDHTFYSPRFNVNNVPVQYIITMERKRQYIIQLSGTKIHTLSCNYKFDVVYRGLKYSKLFTSKGHFRATDATITLLSFGVDDLKAFPHYKMYSPLCFIITNYENGSGYSVVDKCVQTSSYMNNSFDTKSLIDDFRQLCARGRKEGDIEVKCGAITIKAHSFVFNSRSEVLKATLRNDGIIQVHDMDPTTFFDFVQYIYTDMLPELNPEKAKFFYELGDMYELTSLMHRCGEFLKENLTWSNSCEYLSLADAHSDEDLKRSAADYILSKEIYLDDDIWLPFCDKFPRLANEILNESHRLPNSYKKRKYLV